MEIRLSSGQPGLARWRSVAVGVIGWVGGGPAVLCATRGQTDMRGLDRRTMVRRGEPLSRIGRGRPRSWGGLLIVESRVPRALPGRHRPSRRDGSWVLRIRSWDAGDRPAEAGEFAGGGDG